MQVLQRDLPSLARYSWQSRHCAPRMSCYFILMFCLGVEFLNTSWLMISKMFVCHVSCWKISMDSNICGLGGGSLLVPLLFFLIAIETQTAVSSSEFIDVHLVYSNLSWTRCHCFRRRSKPQNALVTCLTCRWILQEKHLSASLFYPLCFARPVFMY